MRSLVEGRIVKSAQNRTVCASQTQCNKQSAARLRSEGLEQLDRIAGRILDKDLFAAIAGHDLVAEPPSLILQFLDGRFQVFEFNLDAVPATRRRKLTIRHGLSSPAGTGSVE